MLNNDYIMPNLCGALGNILFIIAHALAKSIEFNKQLIISKDQLCYNNIDELDKNIFNKFTFVDHMDINEKYFNPSIPSNDNPTQYSGYFQSEKYFEKYSEVIKWVFGPPDQFINKIKREIPEIFIRKTTCINVRRGDYLYYPNYHPVLSIDYICKAKEYIDTEQYLIMSDDIEWCKNNIVGSNYIYIGTDIYKSHELLWILSLCNDFIISNSSFSWWGAYLSRNKNKKVIAPEIWFGPDGPSSWSDMYCKDWIILPSFFENGEIKPKKLSILTLTYKRPKLLEEAIQSFLLQPNMYQCEMVIINDDENVEFIFDHPNIKIFNLKTRFPSISEKIEWGYKQCFGDYIYRLDDDDLLTPWALENTLSDIQHNPNFEIYRSSGMYLFDANKFINESSNINNGNVYSKKYLDRIEFPKSSFGEDNEITFKHNANIYQSNLKHTMIYRWGTGSTHVSGLGDNTNEFINNYVELHNDNTTGVINLNPHFNNDYYSSLQ